MANASALELALIGLLKQKPQSGYDLRKQFTATPMRHFSDSPGSIYPALRRLQARGWIVVSADEQGRKRQVYRVSAAGHKAFGAWLKQPPTREEIIWRLGEVMLRFAFQDGNVPRPTTSRFLAAFEQELAAYVRELREYAKRSGLADQASTGALAFASGIEGYEAQLVWVKRARTKFREKRS